MTNPFADLNENMGDVERLLEIHQDQAGPKPGRKYEVEPLNKSGVVLVHACWEAFVEDCASAAFDGLMATFTLPADAPEHLRRSIAERLKADKNQLSPWRLAGDGWRKELAALRDRRIRELNTPSAKNVDTLYKDLLGITSISSHWRWHRKSAPELSHQLDEFIRMRGGIAHRSAASRNVHKSDVLTFADMVRRIAGITSNRVRAHLHGVTGTYPWGLAPEPLRPGRPPKRLDAS
jgi:hypothetical protein